MYTTTITLNPGNVLAANAVSSRYTCHQAVMALTGEQGRVLWCLETGIYPKLMVRSPDRPDLETFLCSRPGYAVDVTCDRAEPDYKERPNSEVLARRQPDQKGERQWTYKGARGRCGSLQLASSEPHTFRRGPERRRHFRQAGSHTTQRETCLPTVRCTSSRKDSGIKSGKVLRNSVQWNRKGKGFWLRITTDL